MRLIGKFWCDGAQARAIGIRNAVREVLNVVDRKSVEWLRVTSIFETALLADGDNVVAGNFDRFFGEVFFVEPVQLHLSM